MSTENLRKAIQVSTGNGAALVPYDLDPILHEELISAQPLMQLLGVLPASAKTHEYNVRTAHPSGWFEGEATPSNYQASTYQRRAAVLKIIRNWGGVTGFAQAVTEKFINALSAELTGSVAGMADVIEWSTLFGVSDTNGLIPAGGFTGDAYQFTGILPWVYDKAASNVIDAAGAKVTLTMLDNAIELSSPYRRVAADPKLWAMSFAMKNVVDGLQTRVQIPLRSLELFDGKLVMASYAGLPIFETNIVAPAASTSSPSDLSAAEANGQGSLAATTYYYKIASVTLAGEQVASNEATVTTAGGGDGVTLTWTADANAKAYMVFRGTTTGNANLGLIDIIPAKTYDAAGTVNGTVATYLDAGAKTRKAGIRPLAAGEEIITLVNRSELNGAAYFGMVDDMGSPISNVVSYVEMARTRDAYDYMLKSYLALRLTYPNLISVIRNVKKT